MKSVKFAAHTRNDFIMIFTPFAKTSDDRNENLTENFELPRGAMSIRPQVKTHVKNRRYDSVGQADRQD